MSENISQQFNALVSGQGIGENYAAQQAAKNMEKSAESDHALLHNLSENAVEWHKAGRSDTPHVGCLYCGKLMPLEEKSSQIPHHNDDFGQPCTNSGQEVTLDDMVSRTRAAQGIAANINAFEHLSAKFGPANPVNSDGSCKTCSTPFPHLTKNK